METSLAFVIGGLYAAGVYLLLRRNIVKLIIGLMFLSQASNLLIFVSSGLTRGRPPIAPPEATELVAPYADPLPQALILTAIVISFGVLAFFIVLVYQAYKKLGTEDLDLMKRTET